MRILELYRLKFIYSEKAIKFYEIFPLLLTTVHTVKSKGMISQNFVAFSEYMNFNGNKDFKITLNTTSAYTRGEYGIEHSLLL